MDFIEIVNNYSGSPQSIVAIYQALIISYYWGGSIFKGSQVWKKNLVSINHLTAVKIFKEKMNWNKNWFFDILGMKAHLQDDKS